MGMYCSFVEVNTTENIYGTYQGALWNTTSGTISSFKAACNNKEGKMYDDAVCDMGNKYFKEEHPAAYAGATALDYTIPSTYLGYAGAATALAGGAYAYKNGLCLKTTEADIEEPTTPVKTPSKTPSTKIPVKKPATKSWFEEYWLVLGCAALVVLLAVAAVLFFCCKKDSEERPEFDDEARISQV